MTIDRYDAERKFLDALHAHGLKLSTEHLQDDGKIHRCDVAGKGTAGAGDGAYSLRLETNYAFGGYQDWTDGRGWVRWNYQRPRWQPTAEERREIERAMEQAQNEHQKFRAKARAEARLKAKRLWKDAEPAPTWHSYLRKKQVSPNGAKVLRFRNGGDTPLLIPMYDANNKLVNLQFIHGDGREPDKYGLKGGPQKDVHYWIAKPKDGQDTAIYICEGWATGKSIWKAMRGPVLVAFNAGNLSTVAEWVRGKYPDHKIVICSDDDWKVEGNPGNTAAWAAAHAIKGLVAVPRFKQSERGLKETDFNDMLNARGAEAVKRALDSAIAPPLDSAAADAKDAAVENVIEHALEAGAAEDGNEADAKDEADGAEQKKKDQKQTDHLIQLAKGADLFHDGDNEGYADITVKGHRETWAVRSKSFRDWLRHQYFVATKSAPGDNALTAALATLESRAQFEGPERELYLRIAGYDGKIYLDLADKDWQAVEIDAEGWRVIDNPPVRFQRRKGMRPLPIPKRGGTTKLLRKYLNLKTKTDFILVKACLLAAFYDRPYPVLKVTGASGSAKSTLLKVLRNLIDPHAMDLRAPPRNEHDLYIAASGSHVLIYDNLSKLQEWLSDGVSRLSTGGSFGTRQYYTDNEERQFAAKRMIMLGAIDDVVVKGDLADRTVALQLELITDPKRRKEREFLDAFELDRPVILGALLKAVARGLRRLPNIHVEDLPRMADFAEWAVACGDGLLWDNGAFMQAYKANRSGVTRDVVEADPVATAVHEFMTGRREPKWSGSATDLLEKLEAKVGEKGIKRKDWPGSPAVLSGRIQSITTPLRRLGIEIVYKREGKARARTITITYSGEGDVRRKVSSASSASSALSTPSAVSAGKNAIIPQADEADDTLQYTGSADGIVTVTDLFKYRRRD